MEPLSPQDREALKRAHPGLTDEEIDRTEELIAQIDELSQIGRSDEAEDMRANLAEHVRQRIPRYQEVMRDMAESRVDEARRQRPEPRVTQKNPPQGKG